MLELVIVPLASCDRYRPLDLLDITMFWILRPEEPDAETAYEPLEVLFDPIVLLKTRTLEFFIDIAGENPLRLQLYILSLFEFRNEAKVPPFVAMTVWLLQFIVVSLAYTAKHVAPLV